MDNRAWKIFVIGLQRSGTTTMAAALNRMGFPCRQFPKELFDNIEDPILERYDAFSDNPLPIVYPALAERFPDSRFILTTRSEEGWLKSVEWVFRRGRIQFGWERDGTADSIHYTLYGTTRFDRARFRQHFQDYHTEVSRFMEKHPSRVLEFNLRAGQGWPELCSFLQAPIPEEPFPHLNSRQPVTIRRYLKHLFYVVRGPRDRFSTADPRQAIRRPDDRIPVRPWMTIR